MTWREQLRPASYRGVIFEVDSHSFTSGRRGSLHEYPLRDRPYFDDTGRKARRFSIEAFVIGDNYMEQRDGLLRACERPGVGILSHPFYGDLRVVCTDVSLSESRREGGVARFTLGFAEAGQDLFPTETVSTSNAAIEAASEVETATANAFDRSFDIGALTGSARDAIAEKIQEVAGDVLADLGIAEDVFTEANAILNDIPTLIRTPRSLAFQVFGLARSIAANIVDVAAIPAAFFDFDFLSGSPSGNSSADTAQRNANQATESLFRRAQLTVEARVLADQSFESSNDAVLALNQFIERTDAEEAADTPIDDIANSSLLDLRARVSADLRQRAALLADITTAEVRSVTPALLLAYRIHDDATRDQEILQRNRAFIPHPLFVPPSLALEVLSR